MPYSLLKISGPSSEPVTVETLKMRCKITQNVEDAFLVKLISGARERFERQTDRILLPQTWELTEDGFLGDIPIYLSPVLSIESIKYDDINGSEQTLTASSYKLDNRSNDRPAWIKPAYGYVWPETYPEINSVRIRFIAGYEDADSVPEEIKNLIAATAAAMEKNREALSAEELHELRYINDTVLSYRINWI